MLEGAQACRATGGGMAPVFDVLAYHLEAGDWVVASGTLFGAFHAMSTKILPRWGIQVKLVDSTDLAARETALLEPV